MTLRAGAGPEGAALALRCTTWLTAHRHRFALVRHDREPATTEAVKPLTELLMVLAVLHAADDAHGLDPALRRWVRTTTPWVLDGLDLVQVLDVLAVLDEDPADVEQHLPDAGSRPAATVLYDLTHAVMGRCRLGHHPHALPRATWSALTTAALGHGEQRLAGGDLDLAAELLLVAAWDPRPDPASARRLHRATRDLVRAVGARSSVPGHRRAVGAPGQLDVFTARYHPTLTTLALLGAVPGGG
ncbi:DUF6895 family protein [Angustibacter aerolatus]